MLQEARTHSLQFFKTGRLQNAGGLGPLRSNQQQDTQVPSQVEVLALPVLSLVVDTMSAPLTIMRRSLSGM